MSNAFQTADLYDTHEGTVKTAASIFKIYGKKITYSGQIVTVKCYEDNSMVKDLLSNTNGKGKVLVVDGGGSLRCALVGDQIALQAVKNEWEGVIVYGCIRDSAAINEMNIGFRALNTNPAKTVKRNVGLTDLPVHFADADFIPGQFVYVDEDGILISPNAL